MNTPGAGGDAESSDDDIEIVPESVDNYWLERGDETPVSFASLPYFKTGEENFPDKSVYVRGTQDNGMRLYLKSVAWKLEFSNDIKPVFHLKTEKYWIQLKKPRKSFETTIRSIMSTAMFLNYALMNPRDPEKVAWSHVRTVYKSWDVAPSRDDLSSHLLVIQHLIELNERLASSSALQTIPTGVPRKRLASARGVAQQSHELYHRKYEEERLGNEKEINDCGDDLNLDEVGNLEETVCCICDDGGDMICCDGPCMRSFHLKGASSSCNTLGLSKADADRMDKFFCPNCKLKRHQCYVCGELGCSDDAAGAGQEVFVCNVATCGHFYHPSCVADLVLKDKDASQQVAMAESIKEGKVFVCPMHNCWKCGQVEVKEDTILQFGVCRRCPKVWHRQCLPSSLLNTDPKRCWYGLLPNQILVYCKRHTIIPELSTPARDHVKFPEGSIASAHKRLVRRKVEGEAKKSKPSKLGSFEKKDMTGLKSPGGHLTAKLSAKQRKPFSPLRQMKPKGREPRKSKVDQGGMAPHCSMAKARDQLPAVNLVKGSGSVEPSQDSEQKCNSPGKGRSDLDAQLARTSVVAAKSPTPRKLALHPLPQRNKALVYKASSVDNDTKCSIIDRAKASVTIESVLKKHEVPASSTEYSNDQDRKYSLVKLESVIEGMRKAVETLENGGSIEDAKVQCSPDYINYIESCRKDLKFYLAPLVHAYSRSFMKPEKLKEIVDRLHWYLKEGDMVVDFACGSNDFSLLMKKKLEESGKACEYRNFDLIQTNNDFNFSKRDWFEVKPSELPDGDRLIIGLNPPFGSKGHRANQYIDHALTFRPKLIVLTVPKETQRLDQKDDMYDLVWEDSNILGGCLPGSVDVDDNNPPLYVWSRPDWTLIYKQIALDQGHIFPISSSSFFRSPCKALSPRPFSHSDFGKEKNRNDEASVELGIKEEIGDLQYCTSQGKSVIVNESIGGREAIGDLDKKKSATRQHMFVSEPIGGQGTVSNPDASNASKLDQNMRIREPLELDGPMFDTQVNDNSPKSYKVKTTTNYTHNDGFVPLKRHTNLKRKGVDSETLGSQLTPEKAGNSSSYESGHDVSRKKRKASDKYICGDEKRNDELAHDNHQSSEKCLPADLGGVKSPERRKLPDKYGMSRQGEDRKASPERSPHSCMANEQRVGSPDKVCPTSVVNLGTVCVANNARNDHYMNPELPKPVSRHDNLPRYGFLNRNFHGQEALSAQSAQWQDPVRGCNVQMPVSYNGAVFATHNTPSGLYSLYPPSGMQDMNCTSNRSGTGHPFGASGAGRAHFLPEFQRSYQYFGPSIIIPSHPAPFYSGPVYPPLPNGCFQPKHSDPLALQCNFLPNQPQYPPINQPQYRPIQETPPNQKNTGGWFDD